MGFRHLFYSLMTVCAACMAVMQSSAQKIRIRPVIAYNHSRLAAPPGMVYVPGGSTIIKYSQSSTDSNAVKKVSMSSFFMDKTECTNQQYRQFTEWVIDSVAVTMFLKDDIYFKEESIKTEDTAAKDSIAKLNGSIKRHINWAKVNHKKIFGSTDPEMMGKLAPMRDENGEIKKEYYTFNTKFLKATSNNPKQKAGEYVYEGVNIYPDEKIWAKDLTNAQVDVLVENYFTTPPYDDYPVVGINWKQARAYTYWRSCTAGAFLDVADYMKFYKLTFSLPTEAQWVYAAGQDMKAVSDRESTIGSFGMDREEVSKDNSGDNVVKEVDTTITKVADTTTGKAVAARDTVKVVDLADSTLVAKDEVGLLENFKQDEGVYTKDGACFTLPVMAYSPNEFGIYNMVGNVAEWVIDAYSPSTFAFVSDVNPTLLYDADSLDGPAMRRKVVRGGSFMSPAKALSPYARDFELQENAHCYIGFRCVMAAPEILGTSVSTRQVVNKKSAQSKGSKKGKSKRK
jgi:formylglycine-generating enzyme